MKIIQTPAEMSRWADDCKAQGKSISLVPTMGCLHEGHLSLVDIAKERGGVVVLSIFVNPMQFGPEEDLDAYPRQFKEDCTMAAQRGVDLVFAPADKEMYSDSFQSCVTVTKLAQGMCGGDRPGHFDGVATVVSKLFNITRCDMAVFGQKDFQQLAVIRQFTDDLNFPVKIIGASIVREDDGLAMSSRNKYLDGEDRQTALCLFKAISKAKEMVAQHGKSLRPDTILAEVKAMISSAGAALEYAEIIDEKTLTPVESLGPGTVIALAAKIGGRVRLIDNSTLM